MEAYYLEIKSLHVAAVVLSGTLFFIRGFGINVFRAAWPMRPGLRYFSYAVDAVLLTAAILLLIVTRQYPLVDAWLTVKVALVVVYIVLGSFGLKRGSTPRARLAFWIAALLVFGFIVTVAIAHHPLGFFSGAL